MKECLIEQVAQLKLLQELEKAAECMQKSQCHKWFLKSNGTNLTPERITKLLNLGKFKITRATAFLNADVELQALGFDPLNYN
jgi:hypothetical protein